VPGHHIYVGGTAGWAACAAGGQGANTAAGRGEGIPSQIASAVCGRAQLPLQGARRLRGGRARAMPNACRPRHLSPFRTPRDRADLLQRAYVGASSPEVYLESFYYENSPKVG
jgi:hypothetical protein